MYSDTYAQLKWKGFPKRMPVGTGARGAHVEKFVKRWLKFHRLSSSEDEMEVITTFIIGSTILDIDRDQQPAIVEAAMTIFINMLAVDRDAHNRT